MHPKISTTVLAHHFKSCGRYTHWQEYEVNLISLSVLHQLCSTKQETDRKTHILINQKNVTELTKQIHTNIHCECHL